MEEEEEGSLNPRTDREIFHGSKSRAPMRRRSDDPFSFNATINDTSILVRYNYNAPFCMVPRGWSRGLSGSSSKEKAYVLQFPVINGP